MYFGFLTHSSVFYVLNHDYKIQASIKNEIVSKYEPELTDGVNWIQISKFDISHADENNITTGYLYKKA